ncbi:hypothetical protein PMAYCL1PPCAC_21536, partial [Pristionchus mayeri]
MIDGSLFSLLVDEIPGSVHVALRVAVRLSVVDELVHVGVVQEGDEGHEEDHLPDAVSALLVPSGELSAGESVLESAPGVLGVRADRVAVLAADALFSVAATARRRGARRRREGGRADAERA